jgi:hypothetical protein
MAWRKPSPWQHSGCPELPFHHSLGIFSDGNRLRVLLYHIIPMHLMPSDMLRLASCNKELYHNVACCVHEMFSAIVPQLDITEAGSRLNQLSAMTAFLQACEEEWKPV